MTNYAFKKPPLVTIALLAYNQECFIQEAVKSVLSQSYCPLEVFLSDDFSEDNTFSIIKLIADTYKGPHNVIVNQNERNLGIGEHINRVNALSHGDLIVLAAGDDISVPNRVTEIVNEWCSTRSTTITSNVFTINDKGQIIDRHYRATDEWKEYPPDKIRLLKQFILYRSPHPIGAAHAYSRKVFEVFGPLEQGIVWEDYAITFRSFLLEGLSVVNKRLIYYRTHENALTNRPQKTHTVEFLKASDHRFKNLLNDRLFIYDQHLIDLCTARNKKILSAHNVDVLIELINKQIELIKTTGELRSNSFSKRLCACLKVFFSDAPLLLRADSVMRILPMPVYYLLRVFRKKLQHIFLSNRKL